MALREDRRTVQLAQGQPISLLDPLAQRMQSIHVELACIQLLMGLTRHVPTVFPVRSIHCVQVRSDQTLESGTPVGSRQKLLKLGLSLATAQAAQNRLEFLKGSLLVCLALGLRLLPTELLEKAQLVDLHTILGLLRTLGGVQSLDCLD